MKKITTLLILLVAVLTACNRDFETVEVAPDITLKLPSNYSLVKNKNLVPSSFYEATIGEDKINVFILQQDIADTSSIEEKRRIIKSYMKTLVQTYESTKVDTSDSVTDDILHIDMNVDYNKGVLKLRAFNRFFILKKDIIVIMYQTSSPPSRNSEIAKNRIFKSLRIR